MAAVLGAAGCTTDGDPSAQTALRVTVTGLPAGVDGKVRVTGPGVEKRLSTTTDLRDLRDGRYTVAVEPVAVSGGTGYAVAPEVTVRVSGGAMAKATARYGIVVPDTTRVLPADDTGLVADPVGPTLVFADDSPRVSGLRSGEVLVAGIGPRTPEGLLRKVVSVRRGPNGVEVRTEPATLPDAVPEGEIALRKHSFGDATLHNLRRAEEPEGKVSVDLDLAKGHSDGCGSSISGTVGMNWFPTIDVDWKWKKILGVPIKPKRLKFAVESRRLLTSDFTRSVVGKCAVEGENPPIPHFIGTYVIMLGPVPVVLSTTVQFIWSAEVSAESSVDYSYSSEESVALGIEYKNGEVKPIVDLAAPLAADGSASVEASTKIGLRLGLRLYGVIGPHLDLTFGLRTRADTADGVAACSGFFGDMGWDLGAGVSYDITDIISVERQLLPAYDEKCPFAAEPEDERKVIPHKREIRVEDYQWMIGTWEREAEDPDGNNEFLLWDRITVAADGHVTTNHDSAIGEPHQCEGVLAFNDSGVLVVDISPDPDGPLVDPCDTTVDYEIRYTMPAADGSEPEQLNWHDPVAGERPFHRAAQ